MDSLATQSGGRIDGILGMDVIERWAVEIDYATRTLRLHAPGSYRCPNGCTAIPWVRKGREWFVTGRVVADGRPPVAGRFRLDTGSGGALALARSFVEAHGLLAATPGTVEGTAAGIGGVSRRHVGRVAALSFGPFVVERPVTAFAQDSLGEMARADFAGVIGADILRRFHLVLDAHSHRILVLEYRPDTPLAPSSASGVFHPGTLWSRSLANGFARFRSEGNATAGPFGTASLNGARSPRHGTEDPGRSHRRKAPAPGRQTASPASRLQQRERHPHGTKTQADEEEASATASAALALPGGARDRAFPWTHDSQPLPGAGTCRERRDRDKTTGVRDRHHSSARASVRASVLETNTSPGTNVLQPSLR